MFTQSRQNKLALTMLLGFCIVLLVSSTAAQRDDDDDFDDAGFDNAGYSPNSQDADSSNQNPSGSASSVSDVDDIDDDDDVDETHVSPQVASDSADQEGPQQTDQYQQQHQQQHSPQMHLQMQSHPQGAELSMAQQANYALQRQEEPQQDRAYYPNVQKQHFYAPPNSILLTNVDTSSRDYEPRQPGPYRYKRSTGDEMNRSRRTEQEADIEDAYLANKQQTLVRHKRHSKYIGPVYTYVKTDKHARYKWGVKHKVGKHHG